MYKLIQKEASGVLKNADILCECTRGHEKAVWSAFFGRPVEIDIVESVLRGGNAGWMI